MKCKGVHSEILLGSKTYPDCLYSTVSLPMIASQDIAISSEWIQLWTPIPLFGQERRLNSEPRQPTLSSQIGPVPAPYLEKVRWYLHYCSSTEFKLWCLINQWMNCRKSVVLMALSSRKEAVMHNRLIPRPMPLSVAVWGWGYMHTGFRYKTTVCNTISSPCKNTCTKANCRWKS